MKPQTHPELYERNLQYWPYHKSLAKVVEIVCEEAPQNGTVMDLMCGPGYLLGQLSQRRSDLILHGEDIDSTYLEYARRKYPQASFEVRDVLNWRHGVKFDVVMCTGALHHIPYERQEDVIRRMAFMTKLNGFSILSDCYLRDYSTEKSRKFAAAKLGYEYLHATILADAPDEVIQETADLNGNDVLGREFKTSFIKRNKITRFYFKERRSYQTWPERAGAFSAGDHIDVLRGPKV